MSIPVEADRIGAYHGLYARLVHLCERYGDLPDEAHLCVMEAFNALTEVDLPVPDALPNLYYGPVRDVLHQVRRLLTGLITSSSDLEAALALIRVDACIEAALGESL
jgi:hypothetical protein